MPAFKAGYEFAVGNAAMIVEVEEGCLGLLTHANGHTMELSHNHKSSFLGMTA